MKSSSQQLNKRKVLVFPGGTEVGLEIWRSLKDCKEVSLYSVTSDISNHADFVYKNNFVIPDIYSEGWITELNKVIKQNQIDYVFPAHDFVLSALQEKEGDINAKIISSPKQTCDIVLSKRNTYKLLKNLVPIPTFYDEVQKVKNFPVFIKPDKSYGSQGAQKVESMDELLVLLKDKTDILISEYLPGKEYTIDCFSDRDKGLMFCSGRERIRIRMGTAMDSRPVSKEMTYIFRQYAESISKKLKFHGAWFFQLKQDSEGNFKFLEVNARIAGTMALHRVLGVNFALLSIFEYERKDIKIKVNTMDVQIDRALTNRYKHNLEFNTIYVDMDDTLLIHNTLNIQLLGFLYQSSTKGKKIILISKSLQDLDGVLKKWRIKELFDQTIWLKVTDRKSDHISPDKAIYIDDSFSQRQEVSNKFNIPTFDSSMIELLVDERV